MGEIAEMMLDGTLCEGCGVYLEGEGQGFPRYCGGCRSDRRKGTQEPQFNAPRNPAKVACPTCGRHVKAVGLKDHQRDAHGLTP